MDLYPCSEIYPMASHDKVRNFHLLSATDPNKQMNNDEHPSSPKNNSKNMLPKAAYFLVDLVGTAWPSWHLAKFLPLGPCMRFSSPAGSNARCKAESRFLVTSSRAILGFCQRTPNGWSLFRKGAYPQHKNCLKMILPEDVRKSVKPTMYPLDPNNLVKRTFAHPQLFPSEGIKKSSTRSSWRNKGKWWTLRL